MSSSSLSSSSLCRAVGGGGVAEHFNQYSWMSRTIRKYKTREIKRKEIQITPFHYTRYSICILRVSGFRGEDLKKTLESIKNHIANNFCFTNDVTSQFQALLHWGGTDFLGDGPADPSAYG